tara:strand:- start:2380 stop:2733 length:354 start_codon:yes stop_codon:yes gene_type:complete
MINSVISGIGSILPERVIPNSYFSDNKFFTKDGKPNSKSTKDVITKLEEISCIKSRRYIPENEDSVPMMKAAAGKAIEDAGLDKELVDGIIVARWFRMGPDSQSGFISKKQPGDQKP